MALRLIAPSPVTRLVSVSAFKTERGESGSANDARYGRILDAVSRAFAQELGWPLPRQRYTETLSGPGRRRLLLSARPVDRNSLTVTVDELALTLDTDYTVEDAAQGILYRSAGWPIPCGGPGEAGEELISVTYKAGWILPAQISDFSTTVATAFSLGSWLRPAASQLSTLLMECTTAGTTAAGAEPTWPTTAGNTQTSGTATFTARDASELPGEIYEVALVTASQWADGALDLQAGIESESADGFRIAYDTQAARDGASPLPVFARSVLESYR